MPRNVLGACNCGQISYAATGELFGVIICHCSICRRLTGSVGFAVALVDNDNFEWLSGEEHIRSWVKPGHDWQTWFCGICSSPVPGRNDDERMFLPVGTISQGHEDLRVIHHIWTDSKAHWEQIGDQGKQHSNAFED